MAQHNWDYENFDWDGLYRSINYIDKWFRFWRIGVYQAKGKFGTTRIYCKLGVSQIHDLTHPGHASNRYPKWLWLLDCKYGRYIVKYLVSWWMLPLHKFIYRDIYRRAVKKYPHLIEKILDTADFDDLLNGLKTKDKKL